MSEPAAAAAAAADDSDSDEEEKVQVKVSNTVNDGWTILQFIEDGDTEMIGFMQATGEYPDLSLPGDCGTTPLYLALLHDRPEVIKLLYQYDVDLMGFCDPMNYGRPVYWAAKMGRVNCLRMLGRCGVEIEPDMETNKFGETLKTIAEKYNPAITVKEMLNVMEWVQEQEREEAAVVICGLGRIILAKARVQAKMRESSIEEPSTLEGTEGAVEVAEDF